jgi:hypothetical protein
MFTPLPIYYTWGVHDFGGSPHIRHFTTEYYPPQAHYTVANCWDETTQQWYNYGPNADAPAELIKSIAITP